MKKILLIFLMLSVLLVTGCSQSKQQEATHQDPNSLEYVIGSDKWPLLIKQNANTAALEAYQFAIDHPEILDYIPCYCGCGESAGHINNTDCFVYSVKDNIATLDTHGFG